MKKKMICFDLDGTLLTDKGELNESACHAVRQLTHRPDLVLCIATGRGPYMFGAIRSQLGVAHYISYNGQYCVSDGREILRNLLHPGHLQEICLRAAEQEIPLGFMTAEYTKTTAADHLYVRESFQTVQHAYPIVAIPDLSAEAVYQGQLFCSAEQAAGFFREREYFRFVRWHPYAVDIIPPNGSKLEGIKRMAAHHSIDLENVIAFGDGLNDLEMIEHVGFGICMGNGRPQLKAVADYVTTDNEGDGIVRALEYLRIL